MVGDQWVKGDSQGDEKDQHKHDIGQKPSFHFGYLLIGYPGGKSAGAGVDYLQNGHKTESVVNITCLPFCG